MTPAERQLLIALAKIIIAEMRGVYPDARRLALATIVRRVECEERAPHIPADSAWQQDDVR